MPEVPIRDVFAHEAAHALTYDVFDIPVARLWVESDKAGRHWGMAERLGDAQLTHGAAVLGFMSGAGVLIEIFGLSFDCAINRVTSDLCTMLRLLGYASEEEARVHLARLHMATHGFVRMWVRSIKDPIMRLAFLLQENRVSDHRWELSGDDLHRAMQRSWGTTKFPARPTRAFVDREWNLILNSNAPLSVHEGWQTIVLGVCDKNNEPLEG
jgi:hypothetical protein